MNKDVRKKLDKQILFKNRSLIRGQRPNESQKAVIIDVKKSAGEISSKKSSCLEFYPFWGKFDFNPLSWPKKVKVIDTWIIECALSGCTKYEVSMWNSIQDMASCLVFDQFWWNFDLDLWPWHSVKVIITLFIKCALLICNLVPNMKSVGKIASKIWPVV